MSPIINPEAALFCALCGTIVTDDLELQTHLSFCVSANRPAADPTDSRASSLTAVPTPQDIGSPPLAGDDNHLGVIDPVGKNDNAEFNEGSHSAIPSPHLDDAAECQPLSQPPQRSRPPSKQRTSTVVTQPLPNSGPDSRVPTHTHPEEKRVFKGLPPRPGHTLTPAPALQQATGSSSRRASVPSPSRFGIAGPAVNHPLPARPGFDAKPLGPSTSLSTKDTVVSPIAPSKRKVSTLANQPQPNATLPFDKISDVLSNRARANDDPSVQPDSDADIAAAATSAVTHIRTFLGKAFYKPKPACAVCFVISGIPSAGHAAGENGCPYNLCKSEPGWYPFFTSIKLDSTAGLCYRCYLPTKGAKGLPGAKYHRYSECEHPDYVRNAIYAFMVAAPQELQDFVSQNVNFEWANADAFMAWVLGTDVCTRLPNFLLLFWWIIRWRSVQSSNKKPRNK